MRPATCLITSLILTLAAAAVFAQSTPATSVNVASAPSCCGQPMSVIGEVKVFSAPDNKSSTGLPVPPEIRTEVYGEQILLHTELPAGTYTIEITASENTLNKRGARLFSIDAFTNSKPATTQSQGDPGSKISIAKDVDLFALAGGQAKPYTIKATLKHTGGTLRLVFNASKDNAKFSSIRILDDKGNKVSWLFADDVADMLKLPDTPPVVAGPEIWKDATQPTDKRVADLIRRMTLKEKVAQMMNDAPEISRLNIPEYNYWSEGLHGVARNGIATVFPQAIGMSATFDPALLHTVGDAISTEARAKFNAMKAAGGLDLTHGYYRGLTFWSPNINLFRDPRWGRGQETYGEDPYLTGTMAVQFIKGLQGDDPKYLKVVATAKHFAVHSGPEALRHTFNATPPIRDFYESYLPHFEMAVREGKVYSVMGAYNRVYGAPANESDLLLKTILRRDWGFQGYVVSDCFAIDDIWANHQVETDRAAASAGAVLAGCDLECGNDFRGLPAAVDLNLIGQGAIDQALGRILTSRFKLGLFDPPSQVSYASIKPSENDSPEHAALALKVAHESMVLLKNDGTLPLQKTVKKIALVGPNADGLLPLLGNYNGTPSAPVTILDGLKTAFPGTITTLRGCDNAPRTGDWQIVPDVVLHPTASADPLETGLRAQHFSNEKLAGNPVTTRTEKQIDFMGLIEWTSAGIPIAPSSSRWSADFVAPIDGTYDITVGGTTPYRFIVGGKTFADTFDPAADTGTALGGGDSGQPVVEFKLKAGQSVPLVIETHQAVGKMSLQLLWNRGDIDLTKIVAERVKDADVIIFAGGLDGRMEAEEGDIRGLFQDFSFGDRDTIELPACQTNLLKALSATGKPVIFVNMTGSAVAMPWEAQHLNAILQAWYPGQAAGTAVADTLFGAYNPGGRLPVTFYKSTRDLPAFTDYAMKGHTYRYFTGTPLWPFGYGLSYTTFSYAAMHIDKEQATAADTLTVGFDLTNTGKVAGDEVVQVYAKPVKPEPGDALQRLVAFKRVSLAAGQTAHVDLPVPVQSFRNWDVDKKAYAVPPGHYAISIGAGSADTRASQEMIVK